MVCTSWSLVSHTVFSSVARPKLAKLDTRDRLTSFRLTNYDILH
jgi:hypothetical protein